jgi:AraC-like DNA-binding protein
LGFTNTLATDARLAQATSLAFETLHRGELKIVRQTALDGLLERLTRHLHWRTRYGEDPRLPRWRKRRESTCTPTLNTTSALDQLAAATGVDRFRLTRAFKAAYGIAPHAYLVQLRLANARRMLAQGEQPAAVAMALGFADQSHLGRWFVRAYGLTPALYRKRCSNLPDR